MIIKNLLIFFYDFIFFGGSWVGAAMMRPPSLKKRLGGRRQHIPACNRKKPNLTTLITI